MQRTPGYLLFPLLLLVVSTACGGDESKDTDDSAAASGSAGASSSTGGVAGAMTDASGAGGTGEVQAGTAGQAGSPALHGGGAGQGGSGGVSDPTLSSLTADQLAAVCTDARASFMAANVEQKNTELTCRLVGLYSVSTSPPPPEAEFVTRCQGAYARCLSNPRAPEDACLENADCTATISEFAACVEEYPTYLDRFLSGLPDCYTVTAANIDSAVDFEPQPTPNCAKVWEKCGATF